MDITIEKLINKLDLGVLDKAPVRVFGGLLNRMYKVYTSTGVYAVKHLNPEVMKRKNAKENHILAEEIANIAKQNGISCIPAIIFKDGALQEVDGNFFFIYNWFEGKPINENEITIKQVEEISKLLAKIHNIDFGNIKEKCNVGKEINEVDWDFYISNLENKSIKELLINNREKLIELDKKSTELAKDIRKNMVVSHRDLDLPNVLWDSNSNSVIIDWESAGLVNPCEEVIETAWDWSGGQEYFDINKFNHFLKSYNDNGGNLDNFAKAIYSNFKNKSGCLEYNLKRVCKIECIDEEEQKLGEKEVIRVINEIIKFYKVME